MDRRKFGKKSLHSNLASVFDSAPQTSFKRIASSVCSESSSSSRKRKSDYNDSDEEISKENQLKKAKSLDVANLRNLNNVGSARGRYNDGDDSDNSLESITTKHKSEIVKSSDRASESGIAQPKNRESLNKINMNSPKQKSPTTTTAFKSPLKNQNLPTRTQSQNPTSRSSPEISSQPKRMQSLNSTVKSPPKNMRQFKKLPHSHSTMLSSTIIASQSRKTQIRNTIIESESSDEDLFSESSSQKQKSMDESADETHKKSAKAVVKKKQKISDESTDEADKKSGKVEKKKHKSVDESSDETDFRSSPKPLAKKKKVTNESSDETDFRPSPKKSGKVQKNVMNESSDETDFRPSPKNSAKRMKNVLNESSDVNETRSSPKPVAMDESSNETASKSSPKPGAVEEIPFKKPRTTPVAEEENRRKNVLPKRKISNYQNNNVVTAPPTILLNFFEECGISLSTDEEPHTISKDVPAIREHMSNILSKNPSKCAEIIEAFNSYIDNDANLKKMLYDLVQETREYSIISSSLVRLLLQVPQLQTDLISSLAEKMTTVILACVPVDEDTENWISLLLQQFRFLENIKCPSTLTRHIEELLEIGPEWFQKLLISYIPEIAIDSQHHDIAELLCKFMEGSEHSKLTNVILDIVSNLAISNDYMEKLRPKVLEKLRHFGHVNQVPSLVSFLTSQIDKTETCKEILSAICEINMECYVEHKEQECYENQVRTVEALKVNLLMSKKLLDAAIATALTKEKKDQGGKEAPVFHLILTLLVVRRNTPKAKQVVLAVKQHIRTGYYKPKLLSNFYKNYREAAKILQDSALSCARQLLATSDRTTIDFVIDWFRLMFVNQSNAVYKQREIIEVILLVMKSNDEAAKNCLAIFAKMMRKPEEAKLLHNHCHFFTLLLENLDRFSLENVAVLNDVMHGLCANSAEAHDMLNQDLTILMQKQLSSPNSLYKSRGVLNAVMSIKNYAKNQDTRSIAIDLFEKVVASVEKCPKSKALFYDHLGNIVKETKELDDEFLHNITKYFMDTFSDANFINESAAKDEFEVKYNLNVETLDSSEDQGCIKIHDGIEGAVVPILFRVLRICTQKSNKSDNLEDIDALLGAPILMPKDLDDFEPKTLDFMFNCINWFRETISAFVTQANREIRKKVVARLSDLMNMQMELFEQLSRCVYKYQPSPCYFYQHPIPQFVKSEKKAGRKKKGAAKTPEMSEEETWNKGSEMYAKNPNYFRRLDPKIVVLLDLQMDLGPSQVPYETVNVSQVCFIVNELLMIFENENSESFVRDLVAVLPKICSKLQDLMSEIRNSDQNADKEAVKLLLRLITMLFSWKQFVGSHKYNFLLRDALRCLAQLTTSNVPRSNKDLVKTAYNFFESQMDIVSQISLAVAFVNICQTLMSHSNTFSEENRSKQANMSFGFLSLDWHDDKCSTSAYKLGLATLLKNWIDNETDPLKRISSLVEHLPTEVANLKKPTDCLNCLPSITKNNFSLFYKKIFEGVIKGINIFVKTAESDRERINMWKTVTEILSQTISVCKLAETRQNILLFIRYVPQIFRTFLIKGMPILEFNLKYHTEDVRYIVKQLQVCARHMHNICTWGIQKEDVAISKLAPLEKQLSEEFVYRVKGMCVLNNSKDAFAMAHLKIKNLQGENIDSQTSEEATAEASETERENENGDEYLQEDDADDDSRLLSSDIEDEAESSRADGYES